MKILGMKFSQYLGMILCEDLLKNHETCGIREIKRIKRYIIDRYDTK